MRWLALLLSAPLFAQTLSLLPPTVELTGPDSAKAIWAMEDKLWWPDGSPIKHMHGYGHYHETYQRCGDGHWRIKTLKLTRLRADTRRLEAAVQQSALASSRFRWDEIALRHADLYRSLLEGADKRRRAAAAPSAFASFESRMAS